MFSPLEQFDVIGYYYGQSFFSLPILSVLTPLVILFLVIYFVTTTILSQD